MKVVSGIHSPKNLKFIHHPSFRLRSALKKYDPLKAQDPSIYRDSHMPDDITRDTIMKMHYAAYRAARSRTSLAIARWHKHYYEMRDRAIIGNRKLVYRAVRRQLRAETMADDLIGDCQIVLLQAVTMFNPWIGIRFSTYAYTCLLRALARLSQRAGRDWLSRCLSLDSMPESEPTGSTACTTTPDLYPSFEVYLSAGHPLLSEREKKVIRRRFLFQETSQVPTLENVGREIGLSKERVRQVQATALSKLRAVLLEQKQTNQ